MNAALPRLTAHPGSFRDPNARVYAHSDRIFRALSGSAVENYRFVTESGLLGRLANKGWLIDSVEADQRAYFCDRDDSAPPTLLLEHPKIPFVSHPYEWPFRALQRAALLHLELHLEALEAGATLSDATAYNIQFDGSRPVFIDIASLERYRDGRLWFAHRQFCEQFLNPLLLHAYAGVPYHAWYRGSLEGIPAAHLTRVLPWRRKLDWRVLGHVLLQARLQSSASGRTAANLRGLREKRLSRTAFVGLLQQLRRWIGALQPAGFGATTWSEYERTRTYDERQQNVRLSFVARFVEAVQPRMLWDLGCNAGEFSVAALRAGASRVIGFDFDEGALAAAFDRSERSGLRFLPLFLDAANPSPSQGWLERERQGLQDRATCDALLAMAFEHHLTIGRNVPLPGFLDWILGLAPRGVVEFVDKNDPQVQIMLAIREDVFSRYSAETFQRLLENKARIVKQAAIPDSGRRLFWYEK